MRLCTRADNSIEHQLLYEVEGDVEFQLARAVEGERRFEKLMHCRRYGAGSFKFLLRSWIQEAYC